MFPKGRQPSQEASLSLAATQFTIDVEGNIFYLNECDSTLQLKKIKYQGDNTKVVHLVDVTLDEFLPFYKKFFGKSEDDKTG